MKFKTLDGAIVSTELKRKEISQSKSQGQEHLGLLLANLYDEDNIFEEFSIPGERLFLDFFIPKYKLAFELHGKQHDEFNLFFHQNKANFLQQQVRDKRKGDWCKINGIILVEIRDPKISMEDLKKMIICKFQEET